MAAEFFIAKACLCPRFGIIAVRVDRLFKIRQRFFTIILRKKAESIAKELNCSGTLVATARRDQISQRSQGARLQLRNPFRRNCKVDALSSGNLQSSDSEDLALHV